MSRLANELSAIQQDGEVFSWYKTQIRRFTPDYLATLGSVSRTTIYKYSRGLPVNPKAESEIHKTIKVAIRLKKKADSEAKGEAKTLMMA